MPFISLSPFSVRQDGCADQHIAPTHGPDSVDSVAADALDLQILVPHRLTRQTGVGMLPSHPSAVGDQDAGADTRR
jgi:hypothetical protein